MIVIDETGIEFVLVIVVVVVIIGASRVEDISVTTIADIGFVVNEQEFLRKMR